MVNRLQQSYGNVYVQRLVKSEKRAERPIQRQPEEKKPPESTKDPKDVLGKVVEAASETELGEKLATKLRFAATSQEGLTFLGTLAVPTRTLPSPPRWTSLRRR